jgi:hypothetical protein
MAVRVRAGFEVQACSQAHLTHLQQRSRAIDSFVGWLSMIGRGHGQAYRLLVLGSAPKARRSWRSTRRKTMCARGTLTKRWAFASKPLVATEAGPAILMLYEPQPGKVSSPSPSRLKRANDARRREVDCEHEREATPEQPAVGMSKAGKNAGSPWPRPERAGPITSRNSSRQTRNKAAPMIAP